MRRLISDFFHWLGDLFHEHQWTYHNGNNKEVWVDYRTCVHQDCHKFQSRTAEGFK